MQTLVNIPFQQRLDAAQAQSDASLDLLEQKILTELSKVDCYNMGDREWTACIKMALDSARPETCLQFPNADPAAGRWKGGGQWMFDAMWVDTGGSCDWRDAQRLVLACESEWLSGEYEILEDFLKLAMCNARYRLFIYSNPMNDVDDSDSVQHPANICFKRSKQFSSARARYLLVGFPRLRTGNFRVDSWVVTPDGAGLD